MSKRLLQRQPLKQIDLVKMEMTEKESSNLVPSKTERIELPRVSETETQDTKMEI